MSYKDELQVILYNDSTIQSLVSTWIQSTTTYYMIFGESLIPEVLSADTGNYRPTVKDKTINHYQSGGISGGLPLIFTTHTVNCRAYTELGAVAIQSAVFNALNRVRSTSGFLVCESLPVIQPQDETDNFNAIIEVNIRSL